jgi:hypothetical protein
MELDEQRRPARPDARPTVKQMYALAAALCERAGETFPDSRADASELIRRLRIENGHPDPELEPRVLPGPRDRPRKARKIRARRLEP